MRFEVIYPPPPTHTPKLYKYKFVSTRIYDERTKIHVIPASDT